MPFQCDMYYKLMSAWLWWTLCLSTVWKMDKETRIWVAEIQWLNWLLSCMISPCSFIGWVEVDHRSVYSKIQIDHLHRLVSYKLTPISMIFPVPTITKFTVSFCKLTTFLSRPLWPVHEWSAYEGVTCFIYNFKKSHVRQMQLILFTSEHQRHIHIKTLCI